VGPRAGSLVIKMEHSLHEQYRMSCFVFGWSHVRISALRQATVTEGYRSFPHFLQGKEINKTEDRRKESVLKTCSVHI
jgi:hypothetical protein